MHKIRKLVTIGKIKTHTPVFFFSGGCVLLLKSPLGFSALGSGWIKYVNQQGVKTLAMTALCEITIYDVCQTWAGRRVLYTAQHINHFFDPTSYRIPWQWLLLICEPMCVKSLRPRGDSPLWRAGKYLQMCVSTWVHRAALQNTHKPLCWWPVSTWFSVCGSIRRLQVLLFTR